MLDTMTYVFMDWVAVITNLNSSDTGCLDYETVIECPTCDKKKEQCIPPENHQLPSIYSSHSHRALCREG